MVRKWAGKAGWMNSYWGMTVSDETLEARVKLALRQMEEAITLAHQAISLASAANVRVDGLAASVEKLGQRVDALKVESKTISEIVG